MIAWGEATGAQAHVAQPQEIGTKNTKALKGRHSQAPASMTSTFDVCRPTQTKAAAVSSMPGVVVRAVSPHRDQRGWLIELFRTDELDDQNIPAMAYVSETLPGVVRGPHEHVQQSDLFVFMGPGDFELHLWDRRQSSPTYGRYQRIAAGQSHPLSVVVPPGFLAFSAR